MPPVFPLRLRLSRRSAPAWRRRRRRWPPRSECAPSPRVASLSNHPPPSHASLPRCKARRLTRDLARCHAPPQAEIERLEAELRKQRTAKVKYDQVRRDLVEAMEIPVGAFVVLRARSRPRCFLPLSPRCLRLLAWVAYVPRASHACDNQA